MSAQDYHANEQNVQLAFTKQSAVFDSLYSSDSIIQYKRARVREHVSNQLKQAGSILELNAGTGEDAIYFAGQGHSVHATDVSEGMLNELQKKSIAYQSQISYEKCSFTSLAELQQRGPYDLIFSNFAGLNCTGELDKVLNSLPALTKPGGLVTLVILPKFCLWEFLLLFKGKFKTAFRRLFSANGTKAKVEGKPFRCWYYNPSYVLKHTHKDFELLKLEGLCTIVPPSYIEHFGEKYPRLFSRLKKLEKKFSASWPWNVVGDYYIITLHKKS